MNNKEPPCDNSRNIQKISDEASRLLRELTVESNTDSNSRFQTDTVNHQKPTDQLKLKQADTLNNTFDFSRSKAKRKIYLDTLIASWALWIIIAISAIVSVIGSASVEDKSFSPKLHSSDLSSGLVNYQQPVMTSGQRSFYYKTLNDAFQAVLKSEHMIAIKRLNILKSGPYQDLKGVDLQLIDNKIINAKHQVELLDQSGYEKYSEGNSFGYQMLGRPIYNYKLLFAYSKVCKSPVVVFAYNKISSKAELKADKIFRKPASYISTMYLPYHDNHEIVIEKFICNQ